MRKATAECMPTAEPNFAGWTVEDEPSWPALMQPVKRWFAQIRRKRRMRRDIGAAWHGRLPARLRRQISPAADGQTARSPTT